MAILASAAAECLLRVTMRSRGPSADVERFKLTGLRVGVLSVAPPVEPASLAVRPAASGREVEVDEDEGASSAGVAASCPHACLVAQRICGREKVVGCGQGAGEDSHGAGEEGGVRQAVADPGLSWLDWARSMRHHTEPEGWQRHVAWTVRGGMWVTDTP